MRKLIDPVVTPDDSLRDGETLETHPAYVTT
jgi:hypothetical protein